MADDEHSYRLIVDDSYSSKLAAAVVRYQVTGWPAPLVLGVIIAGFAIYSAVIGTYLGLVGAVVGLVVVYAARYYRTRAAARLAAPRGTELTTRFDPSHFTFEGPNSRDIQAYRNFDPPRVHGDFVRLRDRRTRRVHLIPRELFPDHEFAHFS